MWLLTRVTRLQINLINSVPHLRNILCSLINISSAPFCQPLMAIIFSGSHAFVSIQKLFYCFTCTIYLGLGEENLLRVVSLLPSLDPRDQTQACRLAAGATSWGPFPATPAYFPRPPVFGDRSPHCSPDRVHPCVTPPDSDLQMLGF